MDGGGAVSYKVLVIPEDPTFNGYILKPLTERVLAEAGKPRAQILVLRDPKTGGFEQAWKLIAEGSLKARYGHFDLWLFLPDGDKTRDLATLEATVRGQKAKLLACYIKPEVEVAIIAGHPKADTVGWAEKRAHSKFKETVFEPFLAANGNPTAPGGGRETLTRDALKNYDRIMKLVPEIKDLENRVAESFRA